MKNSQLLGLIMQEFVPRSSLWILTNLNCPNTGGNIRRAKQLKEVFDEKETDLLL